MTMHREAKIYLIFAVLGIALTAYLVERLATLVQRPFDPIDAAVFAAVAVLLVGFTAFYMVLAFIFATRFVERVEKDADSLHLRKPDGTSVQVRGNVRVIRRFGRQFSSNESQPAFVLFIANGHLWVSAHEERQNGV
jgi:hypothetical protein